MAQHTVATKTRPQPRAAEPTKPARKDTNRDLVEQVVVALILAFLIRGFEAEAFVIPTGSMAPTLMGRHKEVTCPQCEEVYPVNASDEVEGHESSVRVVAGMCPNCHYVAKIDEAPSFKGDRILVMKFLYSLPFLLGGGKPERWDVVVFKYPEEPEVNYIKRLVGLPNEELRVYFGDILTRPLGSNQPFRHQRRPLPHQQAMQMIVWNDAHRPKALEGMPDWRRWHSRTPGAWVEAEPGTFTAEAHDREPAELRYRHLVPDPRQWEEILSGQSLSAPPRPTLIGDFYSYNSNVSADRRGEFGDAYPPHWVGDLTLSCRLECNSASGTVRFELVEGGITNRCEIDLATGMATLSHGEQALGDPVSCGIRGKGSHDVTFANVDDRLTLWVDGRTPFGDGRAYSDGSGRHPAPTEADLDPVGIAAQGSSVRVSNLVLKRDIYYTQVPGSSDYSGQLSWPLGSPGDRVSRVVEAFNILADPARFAELGNLKERDFQIRHGHYMMMGDNSPRSKDSRGWEQRDQLRSERPDIGWDANLRESWEVPEALLIGKAFFVYWPHGKPFGPDLRINHDFRVPFRPYVERMKWIR
jgi:signal peptidase I